MRQVRRFWFLAVGFCTAIVAYLLTPGQWLNRLLAVALCTVLMTDQVCLPQGMTGRAMAAMPQVEVAKAESGLVAQRSSEFDDVPTTPATPGHNLQTNSSYEQISGQWIIIDEGDSRILEIEQVGNTLKVRLIGNWGEGTGQTLVGEIFNDQIFIHWPWTRSTTSENTGYYGILNSNGNVITGEFRSQRPDGTYRSQFIMNRNSDPQRRATIPNSSTHSLPTPSSWTLEFPRYQAQTVGSETRCVISGQEQTKLVQSGSSLNGRIPWTWCSSNGSCQNGYATVNGTIQGGQVAIRLNPPSFGGFEKSFSGTSNNGREYSGRVTPLGMCVGSQLGTFRLTSDTPISGPIVNDFDNTPDPFEELARNPSPPSYPSDPGPNHPVRRPDFDDSSEPAPQNQVATSSQREPSTQRGTIWLYSLYLSPSDTTPFYRDIIEYTQDQKIVSVDCQNCSQEYSFSRQNYQEIPQTRESRFIAYDEITIEVVQDSISQSIWGEITHPESDERAYFLLESLVPTGTFGKLETKLYTSVVSGKKSVPLRIAGGGSVGPLGGPRVPRPQIPTSNVRNPPGGLTAGGGYRVNPVQRINPYNPHEFIERLKTKIKNLFEQAQRLWEKPKDSQGASSGSSNQSRFLGPEINSPINQQAIDRAKDGWLAGFLVPLAGFLNNPFQSDASTIAAQDNNSPASNARPQTPADPNDCSATSPFSRPACAAQSEVCLYSAAFFSKNQNSCVGRTGGFRAPCNASPEQVYQLIQSDFVNSSYSTNPLGLLDGTLRLDSCVPNSVAGNNKFFDATLSQSEIPYNSSAILTVRYVNPDNNSTNIVIKSSSFSGLGLLEFPIPPDQRGRGEFRFTITNPGSHSRTDCYSVRDRQIEVYLRAGNSQIDSKTIRPVAFTGGSSSFAFPCSPTVSP